MLRRGWGLLLELLHCHRPCPLCSAAQYSQRTPPTSTDFASISLGESHGCGLTKSGGLICWGRCIENQCIAPAGNSYTQVSGGYLYTCATTKTGAVVCFGNTADPSRAAAMPPPLNNAVQVAAGMNATCALLTTGAITCWVSHCHPVRCCCRLH